MAKYRLNIDNITWRCGLKQLIYDPTHVLDDICSPNFLMDLGVDDFLYPNCYRHIRYAKFNLKYLQYYPLPYEGKTWYFYKSKTDLIWKAMNDFINSQKKWNSSCFSRTVKIFYRNVFLAKLSCNDKNPPWINSKIKNLIKNKKSAYKNYLERIKTINHLQRFKLFKNRWTARLKYQSKITNLTSQVSWLTLALVLKHIGRFSKASWIIKRSMYFSPLSWE